MAAKVKPIPKGFHTVTPYLIVEGAKKTISFMEQALGAQHDHEPTLRPDGTVMHATLKVGDSMVRTIPLLALIWPRLVILFKPPPERRIPVPVAALMVPSLWTLLSAPLSARADKAPITLPPAATRMLCF